MKPFKRTAPLISAFIVSVGWATLSPGPALAQSTRLEANVIQFSPPPPPDRGRPSGRQRGGASRGSCGLADDQSSLTALAPTTQLTLDAAEQSALETNLLAYESVFSLTTDTHPSFWFYLPHELNERATLEFVFQDESGNTLYQTQFAADRASSGIIQLSLPETSSPLMIDESYQWYFLVHCNSAPSAEPFYVKGWIARTVVDADLQAQLDEATMLEKASLYAAHGIWQDALTALAELYREDAHNSVLSRHWLGLLESVGLSEISTQPIIECCDIPQADFAAD